MKANERTAELYAEVAQESRDLAFDESLDPELRRYYAGISLHYADKAERMAVELDEVENSDLDK